MRLPNPKSDLAGTFAQFAKEKVAAAAKKELQRVFGIIRSTYEGKVFYALYVVNGRSASDRDLVDIFTCYGDVLASLRNDVEKSDHALRAAVETSKPPTKGRTTAITPSGARYPAYIVKVVGVGFLIWTIREQIKEHQEQATPGTAWSDYVE